MLKIFIKCDFYNYVKRELQKRCPIAFYIDDIDFNTYEENTSLEIKPYVRYGDGLEYVRGMFKLYSCVGDFIMDERDICVNMDTLNEEFDNFKEYMDCVKFDPYQIPED